MSESDDRPNNTVKRTLLSLVRVCIMVIGLTPMALIVNSVLADRSNSSSLAAAAESPRVTGLTQKLDLARIDAQIAANNYRLAALSSDINADAALSKANNSLVLVKEIESQLEDIEAVQAFDGYEGSNQALLEATIQDLPVFLHVGLEGVTIVNGCHPWSQKDLGACPFGTYDDSGWNADGTWGHAHAQSLWVSNSGVNSGQIIDIAVHEAAHAMSYNVLRTCGNWRAKVHEIFGGEEPFADAMVAYVLGTEGSHQFYRGHNTPLSIVEEATINEAIAACVAHNGI